MFVQTHNKVKCTARRYSNYIVYTCELNTKKLTVKLCVVDNYLFSVCGTKYFYSLLVSQFVAKVRSVVFMIWLLLQWHVLCIFQGSSFKSSRRNYKLWVYHLRINYQPITDQCWMKISLNSQQYIVTFFFIGIKGRFRILFGGLGYMKGRFKILYLNTTFLLRRS